MAADHRVTFPEVPLAVADHARVRELLVREARRTARSRPRLRLAAPAVASVVALGGGGLLVQAATEQPPSAACAAPHPSAADVPDELRLLQSDPGFRVREVAVAEFVPVGDKRIEGAWSSIHGQISVVSERQATASPSPTATALYLGDGLQVDMVGFGPGSEEIYQWRDSGRLYTAAWMPNVGVSVMPGAHPDRNALMSSLVRTKGRVLEEGSRPILHRIPGWTHHSQAVGCTWMVKYEDVQHPERGVVAEVDVSTGDLPWQAWAGHGTQVKVGADDGLWHASSSPLVGRLRFARAAGVNVMVDGAWLGDEASLLAFAEGLKPVAADDPRLAGVPVVRPTP